VKLLKCTQCGGVLVWDYERGEVVCSSCGLVVDKITTLEAWSYRVNNNEVEQGRREADVATIRNRAQSSREYRRLLKIYKLANKMVKEKPWLEVDYEKVIESGKFVLTVKSKASIKALKNIVEYGYMELVKEGLDYISSVNPALLARSERSKYALAYMVAVKIKTGVLPTRESVLKVFNISNTSYNRLRNIVEKILREASVIQSQ
jgi:transcription initiation factor TFIIIB Brf1 subunit/transcription initiation factor TFIIB